MEESKANTTAVDDVEVAATTAPSEEEVSPVTMTSTAPPETPLEEVASPVIKEVDSTMGDDSGMVSEEEKPVEEVVNVASPETPSEGTASPMTEEVDSSFVDSPVLLEEEEPVEEAVNEANESPLKDVTSPAINESFDSAIDVEEEKPVEEAIDEAHTESPMEGMVSPMIKEVYSFFVDSSVVSKDEKPVEEAVDEVSSTEDATEQETKVEEHEEKPIAQIHLSGYFPSLEDRLPPSSIDLIYWRQPIVSGAVFSTLFVFLLSCSAFSFISVTAYVSMVGLGAILSYVLFKKIATAVQRTAEMIAAFVQKIAERLRSIDRDIEQLVTADDLRNVIQASMDHAVKAADIPSNLFHNANSIDFIKWAVFLWTLTYVGGMVNLLTLFIVALVLMFSVPKAYEVYGSEIDAVASKLMSKWLVIQERVADPLMLIKEKAIAAIPFGKEKSA